MKNTHTHTQLLKEITKTFFEGRPCVRFPRRFKLIRNLMNLIKLKSAEETLDMTQNDKQFHVLCRCECRDFKNNQQEQLLCRFSYQRFCKILQLKY